MSRVTVVVPVHNEAGNIHPLYEAVDRVFAGLTGYAWRLLFIDDGSSDDSAAHIERIAAKDDRVSLVRFSRNFGKEAALSAGIAHAADADAIVLMDGDLQHPPAVIPEFIRAWEAGADVVVGVRGKNPDEGAARRFASRSFAAIMRAITDVPTVPGATDFRLIDRSVARAFLAFTEHGRIARGLIDWLGFSRTYVSFDAGQRHAGQAQYGFFRLVGLGFSAFLSHSLLPLRLAGYLGVGVTLISGVLGLFILVEQVMLGDPLHMDTSPIGMIAVMILFLNGIVLVCIGLVSLYIERIHQESLGRPLYVERAPRRAHKA